MAVQCSSPGLLVPRSQCSTVLGSTPSSLARAFWDSPEACRKALSRSGRPPEARNGG